LDNPRQQSQSTTLKGVCLLRRNPELCLLRRNPELVVVTPLRDLQKFVLLGKENWKRFWWTLCGTWQ